MGRIKNDFKSRFRILKGGKISLVVSAMLVGVMATVSNADVIITNGQTVTTYQEIDGTSENATIENGGSINITDFHTMAALRSNNMLDTNYSITNSGTITMTDNNMDATGIQVNSSYDNSTSTFISNKGTITNNGSINIDSIHTMVARGIRLSDSNQGIIQNTQGASINITAMEEATGIYLRDNLMGTVTNAGTISAQADSFVTGIQISDLDSSSVTNSGSIETSSRFYTSTGIRANNLVNNSSILNSGTITNNQFLFSPYESIGIRASSLDQSTITNSGYIDNGMSSNGYNSVGIKISNNLTNNSFILNSGTINLNSYLSAAIEVGGDISGSDVTNSGTISSTTTNGKARGIDIRGNVLSSNIINSNILTASSDNNDAIGIRIGQSTQDSTITNSGTITTTASSNASGIRFYTLNNSSVINTADANITASSTNNHAYGIFAIGDISNNSSISNAGAILVSGTSDNSIVQGIVTQNLNNSTVSNSGTITATANNNGSIVYGIASDTLSNSTITNTNTITTNGLNSEYNFGISAKNLYYNGNISNSGTITVNNGDSAAGISTYTSYSSSIDNSGTVGVSGTDVHGIEVLTSVYNSTLTNSGTLDLTASDAADGIYVKTLNSLSSISNSGSIITNAGGDSQGIQVSNGTDSSSIVNSGSIDITAGGQNADGIRTFTIFGGSITNTASGTIDVNGSASYITGINFDKALVNTTITNHGTITASGANVSGIYSLNGLEDGSSITNTGTISVDGSVISAGVGIRNQDEANLNNQTTTVTYASTQINNSGTITATINGKANYSGFSIASADNETQINNSGTLNGNLIVYGSLANSGTIALPYNANQSTTSAIAYDFTNEEDGILQIGLLTDGTNTSYSQLVTNTATFENGSTIDVNVLEASKDVIMLDGTTLNDVVNAQTDLTIEGTLNVTDNSALLNFEYIEDGETIDLKAVESATILDTTISGGGQTPARAAGAVLDRLNDGKHPAMNGIIGSLNQLSSNPQVANAVNSLTPQVSGTGVGVAGQIGRGIAGIVEQRQTGGLFGGNSGEVVFNERNVWFKPFGSWGEQEEKDGISGFDIDTYGIGMGMDVTTKEDNQMGMAIFYTNADVDVNGVSQSADIDSYTLLGYGSSPILDDKTKLLYQIGYSWQKTDTSRTLFTSNIATADYTSKVASLDLKVMRDYEITDNLLMQPMVGLTYRHFDTPSYTESGAGAANLMVNEFTTTELLVGLGTLVNYKIDEESKIVGTLSLDYDLHDKNNSVTAAFQGAAGITFDTNAIDNGRLSYKAGIGYERDLNESSNINVSYDYSGEGSDYSNSTISLKYIYKF